jgi:hypothetical protein
MPGKIIKKPIHRPIIKGSTVPLQQKKQID